MKFAIHSAAFGGNLQVDRCNSVNSLASSRPRKLVKPSTSMGLLVNDKVDNLEEDRLFKIPFK
jgi:hypothetical protein